MGVSAADIQRLLGAYRAVVTGTASAKTPTVPEALAGYFVGPDGRRPLGETLDLINKEVKRSGLEGTELDVLRLYYGLDLLVVPLSGQSTSTLAKRLPTTPRSTGRPRQTPGGESTDGPVRYVRQQALEDLAGSWQENTGPVFQPTPEPNPLTATWLRNATPKWSQSLLKDLARDAVLAARERAVAADGDPSTLWLDFDWWSIQNEVGPLSESGLGKPSRRINAERHFRAQARVSIEIWRLVSGGNGPEVGDYESSESNLRYLAPTRLRSSVFSDQSTVELLADHVERVSDQRRIGPTHLEDVAVLANASAYDIQSLPPRLRLEGAAAMARAASEHREHRAAGARWLVRCTPPGSGPDEQVLASALVDLSVAASAEQRFGDAQAILRRSTWMLSDTEDATVLALLRLGESAWRRRLVTSAVRHKRGVSRDVLTTYALECMDNAKQGVAAARAQRDEEEAADSSLMLRCLVRYSEAVSVASRAAGERRLDALGSLAEANDRHLRLFDEAREVVEYRQHWGVATPYDDVRLEIIERTGLMIAEGDPPMEFGVLSMLVDAAPR